MKLNFAQKSAGVIKASYEIIKMPTRNYKTLRLILGDQLNAKHSWFRKADESTLYLIAEIRQELTYTRHHIQKIMAFFLAMENFAKALTAAGHQVLHLNLNDTTEYADLPNLIREIVKKYDIQKFEFQRPDEYRLRQQLQDHFIQSELETNECDTEHFLLSFSDVYQYFEKERHYTMEAFYRKIRRQNDILMDGAQPEGGQWNYDAKNRNKLKKDDLRSIPTALKFSHPTKKIFERIKRHDIAFIGESTDQLLWPVTRKESIRLLHYFCENCLPNFGRFQDAMTCQSDNQWSLYHSRLSFSLNTKMISPLFVVQTAVDYYRQYPDKIDIAQIEGFIRQIIGWREYIRGMYWANMPDYSGKNTLDARKKLPDYFWTGDTRMQCVKAAVTQSLKYSYAHHIQRLMVTGNFCLLTGVAPDEVDDWYLGIYVDAIEWVELPNTRGMSQFADGGLVATKPYAASGNYINKMSNYCQHCEYQVNDKTGELSCPFNSLYWYFMNKHRSRLETNPRIGMIYKNWDKQPEDARKGILIRAKWCLENLNDL